MVCEWIDVIKWSDVAVSIFVARAAFLHGPWFRLQTWNPSPLKPQSMSAGNGTCGDDPRTAHWLSTPFANIQQTRSHCKVAWSCQMLAVNVDKMKYNHTTRLWQRSGSFCKFWTGSKGKNIGMHFDGYLNKEQEVCTQIPGYVQRLLVRLAGQPGRRECPKKRPSTTELRILAICLPFGVPHVSGPAHTSSTDRMPGEQKLNLFLHRQNGNMPSNKLVLFLVPGLWNARSCLQIWSLLLHWGGVGWDDHPFCLGTDAGGTCGQLLLEDCPVARSEAHHWGHHCMKNVRRSLPETWWLVRSDRFAWKTRDAACKCCYRSTPGFPP